MIMATNQLTKTEIVLETIEVYNDPTNRALFYTQGTYKDATCQYETSNGNRCAVGRCMTDKAIARYGTSSKEIDSIADIRLDKLLKEEYHGQTLQFWVDLQCLHDDHECWSQDGITEKGKWFVQETFGVTV